MRKSASFVSILLVSLCAIVLIMALAVPAFAADSGYLDALLKQAEQELEQESEKAGVGFWEAFTEAPEGFFEWLAEKENLQINRALSAMERVLPEDETALEGYLRTLYTLVRSVPEEQTVPVYRLMLILEMRSDSQLVYENYDVLLNKACWADGAYTELCLAQLAQAFCTAPEDFLRAMAETAPDQQTQIASLVKWGMQFYQADYDGEAQLDALKETLTTPEQLYCIDLLRGMGDPAESPTEPSVLDPATDPSEQPKETGASEPDTTTGPEASEANQNSADGDADPTAEQPSTEALWWLIPALLAVSVAIIWAICNRKR